ncbi:hypothetical protein CERSUDRAFT_104101 [Gelatoporia subvermispora B]|uniref:Velvet domain-containing protein n=1 Tax=Ceriporiopsis subvermispora (strain B) TaxID=914234 RepID=M2RIV3_CERS8|nr:hypothetical protein CERSUDRAFT_104101 [Gelatoporia subvermispora B]
MELAARVRRADTSEIDTPVAFITGPLSGRKIRAELTEVQKADLGRKYARKDRRPLDPPPVVHLRLFEVSDNTLQFPHEKEITTYTDAMSFGFLCHVDLFPVLSGGVPIDPPQDSPTYSQQSEWMESRESGMSSSTTMQHPAPLPGISAPVMYSYTLPPPPPPSFFATGDAEGTHVPDFTRSVAASSSMTWPPVLPLFRLESDIDQNPLLIHDAHNLPPHEPSDIVAYCGEIPITEVTRCTYLLAGTTFRDSALIDFKGKRSIVFVFSDIAVKQEGTFILRYRVFNIFAQATGPRPNPVIAECFGEPFKIYSTKDFPGLHVSTDLTKSISLHGIRTNIRARERKRRRTLSVGGANTQDPAGSSASSSRGRRAAHTRFIHVQPPRSEESDDESDDEI